MIKLIAGFAIVMMCAGTSAVSAQNGTVATAALPSTITAAERDSAVKLLMQTEDGVLNSIKGLTAAQLAFKSSPDKWSIEECVKHIAAAEKTLWDMVEQTLQQPANPEKREGIKMSDADLIKAVEDRSHKSKTFAALEPVNSPYKTMDEALKAFKENREKLVRFVKNTQADLRNHVAELPIGTFDSYQFILLIAAHSNRHTQQIDEVKSNGNFPK